MNPEILLPIFFLIISIMYSSVGLGGGSSYTAVMVIFGIHYKLIPTISLMLNCCVTVMGMVSFWRRGHLDVKLVLPFLVTSVPMAYMGGAIHLSENTFFWLLLITLILIAVRLYLVGDLKLKIQFSNRQRLFYSLVLGTILGFIAGSVGIGGGIYLVPLLIIFGFASEKQAAAAGASFVFMNSVAGLISRTQRGMFHGAVVFPMVGAVLIGGFVGSFMGAYRFKSRTIQKILGIVILLAIFYLIYEQI